MYPNQSQEQKIQELVAEFSKLSEKEKDSYLLNAASNGQKDNVEALIRCGANVGAKGIYGQTALMWAAGYGNTDIADMLISKYHADVDTKSSFKWTALMCASINGQINTVDMLISKYHANVDAKGKEGWTALMTAAENGHTDIVEILISVGADLTNADLTKVGLSRINTQNQIQFMFIYANDKLDNINKNLNKPFSRSLSEKINQIHDEVKRIFDSAEMAVIEKRKALGEINRQLLKLKSLEINSEKLIEEESQQAKSILDNTLAYQLNSGSRVL